MEMLYLAHSLEDRKIIRRIELEIEKEFNIELVNPFYDIDRPEIKRMDNGEQDRFEFTLADCRKIRQRDLDLIRSCDSLLCIVFQGERMIGSFKEMTFAHENGKRVILISFDKYVRNHLWNRAESHLIFSTIKQFKNYLRLNGYARE